MANSFDQHFGGIWCAWCKFLKVQNLATIPNDCIIKIILTFFLQNAINSITQLPGNTSVDKIDIVPYEWDQSPYDYDHPNLKTANGFLRNLVVILNKDHIEEMKSLKLVPFFFGEAMTKRSPNNHYFDGYKLVSNEGTFIPLEVIPRGERLVHTQITLFRAGAMDEDKALTGSFSHAVTDSFSYKFGEKVSIKAGFKFWVFASFEVTGELNSEQQWTSTKTYTITAPSQSTKVHAHHQKEVTFSVFKGTSLNKGVVRVKVDPNAEIYTQFVNVGKGFYWQVRNQKIWKLRDLVEEVIAIEGNDNLFKSNSVLSKEGNDFFLQFPIEVESDSSRLVVNFGNETPINFMTLCMLNNTRLADDQPNNN